MNIHHISIQTVWRALWRALVILLLLFLQIGPANHTALAAPVFSTGTAHLIVAMREGSSAWSDTNIVCTIYNATHPNGLVITGDYDDDVDYPATINCTFEGLSTAQWWAYFDYVFIFNALPSDTTIEYTKSIWAWIEEQTSSGILTPNYAGHIGLDVTVDSPNGTQRSASLSLVAEIGGGYDSVHCNDIFTPLYPLVIAADIIPQIEFPKGPFAVSPDAPDEQIVDLAPGVLPVENTGLFRLTIDGLWGDGTLLELDEYEISFDGVEWMPPDDLDTLCVDSNGWIFQTDEEHLYIRVADAAGQFADNTPTEFPYPTFDVYLMEQIAPAQCSDQFSYDAEADFVAAGIIDANNMYGTVVEIQTTEGELIPGAWYVLETLNGPWANPDGVLTESYDIAVDTVDSNIVDEVEFSEWEFTHCWEYVDETETNKRYFFQAPETTLNLWVHDPSFTYAANSGRINFTMYQAEFTYWPAACERQFVIGDTLFETEIQGSSPNGMFLEPISADTFSSDILTNPYDIPGAGSSLDQTFDQNMWYVLETVLGPWKNNGVQNRWDMDIRDDSTEFVSFPEWPNAECVVRTDAVGHYRVYFQFPPGDADIIKYVMRVSDGDSASAYPANTGSMTVVAKRATLAQVIDPGTIPTENACNGMYSRGNFLSDAAIPANREIGIYAPSLQTGNVYALETIGYWKDGSDPIEYTLAQISDDNGESWYDWEDYPSALCYEVFMDDEPRAHIRLYIRAEAGSVYKIRASNQDTTWGNNVSYLYGLKTYEAQMLLDPFNTCRDAYQMTNIPLGQMANIIPGFMETGITVPTVTGLTYGIEIYDGEWQETAEGDLQYDAALSVDNGENFYPFSDRALPGYQCYAKIGDYEWIYFTAADDYTKIRVNGESGEFDDNEGALYYRLYAARNIGDPDTPGDDIPGSYTPASWDIGCYASPVRPAPLDLPAAPNIDLSAITGWDAFADLAAEIVNYINGTARALWLGSFSYVVGWITYSATSAINFFLWCPEHTQAIMAILNDIRGLEPFATVRRMVEFSKLTKAQVESYEWVMENAAAVPFSEEGGGFEIDTILPDVSDSPFAEGGQIEWRSLGGGESVTSCNSHLVLRWGTENPLVVGFCTVLNLAKLTNWNRVLNIGIVISAVLIFLRYLQKRWLKELISLVSGGGFAK